MNTSTPNITLLERQASLVGYPLTLILNLVKEVANNENTKTTKAEIGTKEGDLPERLQDSHSQDGIGERLESNA